jgi:hypothetical protein
VPTIAVLYEDQKYRHIKTYVVDVPGKTLKEGPWHQVGAPAPLLPHFFDL